MAPSWPEEVDVFTVPHSRMKKLVHQYSNMITTTDFRDESHLTSLLQNLMNVFAEFKMHEQIENMLIMKKLKTKLKAASVTSAAVCNCHNDNRLTDMLDLVEDGYRWAQKTEQERQMYGKQLRSALDIFTLNFIPHMEEEEEVFQPMLMEYFSYEELKEMKAKVISQHHISDQQEENQSEKFVQDSNVGESIEDGCNYWSKLPSEVCLQILRLLGPRELTQLAQVSCRFQQLTRDPSLWSRLYPVHWARGNWSFNPQVFNEPDGQNILQPCANEDECETYPCIDEDADIDESEESDSNEYQNADTMKQALHEAKLLTSLVKHLLPVVGPGIKICDLAYSRGLSSSMLHRILKLCPNLEYLDLTHTKVGDIAFKELGASDKQLKLRHLDLTSCENITDLTLISLAAAGRKSVSSAHQRDMEIENFPVSCCLGIRCSCCKIEACGVHSSVTENCLVEQTACYREITSYCTVQPVPPTKNTSVKPDCPHLLPNHNQAPSVKPECPHMLANHKEVPEQSCYHQNENTLSHDVMLTGGSRLTLSHTASSSLVNSLTDPCTFSHTASSSLVNSLTDPCTLSHTASSSLVNSLTDPCTLSHTASSSLVNSFTDPCLLVSSPDNAYISTSSSNAILSLALSQRMVSQSILRTSTVSKDVVPVLNQQHVCAHGKASLGGEEFQHIICCTDPLPLQKNNYNTETGVCALEFLSLSGCHRITDDGLHALAQAGGVPHLQHLDLSGCLAVTAAGLSRLVSTCSQLNHYNLFYCDNISDDPYFTTASGCRNRQSTTRFCCSMSD